MATLQNPLREFVSRFLKTTERKIIYLGTGKWMHLNLDSKSQLNRIDATRHSHRRSYWVEFWELQHQICRVYSLRDNALLGFEHPTSYNSVEYSKIESHVPVRGLLPLIVYCCKARDWSREDQCVNQFFPCTNACRDHEKTVLQNRLLKSVLKDRLRNDHS